MRKVGETVYGTVTSLATALEFPISVLKVRRNVKILRITMSSNRILLDLSIGCQMQRLLLVPCVTGLLPLFPSHLHSPCSKFEIL